MRIACTTLRLSACVVLIALRACRLSEAFPRNKDAKYRI
jgi:hypothetical protein